MITSKTMSENKSGVALVIVLALLALLMIISASFLFTMRIERSGAANNRHDWVANQIAHTGLDYALADIDHFFLNSDQTSWTDGDELYWTYDSGKRKFKLHANTFVSLREDYSKNQAGKDNKNVPEADSFIPLGSKASGFLPPALAYRGSANEILDNVGKTLVKIDPPEWIPVRPFGKLDAETVNGQRNPVVGRYAFMAFDTTGMIDANHVMKGDVSRAWGLDPSEIQLDYETFAADFKDENNEKILEGKNVKNFMDIRDADGAYVSIQDMAALNDYFDSKYSRHLKTLSYEPLWPAWTNADAVVDISGDAKDLEGEIDNIETAFIDSGLTKDQAYYAARGLIDYVDEDSRPYGKSDEEKFCRPVSERVPLMAGGMAKIKVRRWRMQKITEAGIVPADTYKYELSGEWAVPFTWMFDERPKHGKYKIEGKMAIQSVDETKLYSDLFPKDIQVKSEDDYYLPGKGIVQDVIPVGKCEIAADKVDPENLAMKLKVSFAGATISEGETVRQYPLRGYDSKTSKGMDKYWMTTSIDTEDTGDKGSGYEKVKFKDDGTVSEEVTGPKGVVQEVKCPCQKAEFVVWVDVFDPRYGFKGMGNSSERDMMIHGYFRASHRIPSRRIHEKNKINEMSIVELSNDNEPLSGFQGKVHDIADDAGKGIKAIVNKYYPSEGYPPHAFYCSSLSSYVLGHPDILRDDFNIHVDGVRLGASDQMTDSVSSYWRAYVRNEPLESVGELGFLPIGPWLTIRLYDYGDEDVGHSDMVRKTFKDNRIPGCDGYFGENEAVADVDGGYHTVLDHFAINPKKSRCGRISVDSLEQGVVAAPFYQLPVLKVNAKKGWKGPISKDDAKELAKVVMRLREDGELNKCSDFGKMFRQIDGMKYGESSTGGEIACPNGQKEKSSLPSQVIGHTRDKMTYVGEFEREALIGKSYNLFTNRGRSFIIVVKAQAYTPGFFKKAIKDEAGAIHASRTLVAEVWRDTVDQNNDGVYPWKLVSVTVLDE